MKCAGCGKVEGADLILKSCSACHSVSYCSSACQRAGWPGHRAACNQKKSCAGCGKKAGPDLILKSCSACQSVSYCSSGCQTAAWKEHRVVCNQLRASGGSGVGVMGSLPTAPLSSTVERYTEADYFNACGAGRHEELQKVLEQRDIDVNWAHPDNGQTAMYDAAMNGHDKCLAAIIRHGGADLSKMDKDGLAPIHVACLNGRIACLSLLLDNGIEANVRARDELTPALICSGAGHVKCLALLLDRGSDPGLAMRDGITSAHAACMHGQVKSLQLLIARGANFNAEDSSGQTPLDFARIYQHSDCVELLIENKAQGKRAEDIPPMPEALKVRMRC